MPQSDPFQILLSHDRWATEQMFAACEKLPAEQFHQRFEIGPGSLHDTLTHMIAAMRIWTDTLVEREARPRVDSDGKQRSIAELRGLFEESTREFDSEARRRPLEEIVTRTMRDGRTIQLTRGAVVTHVASHGMHHRAQCLNMLRQLRVKPLPHSSVAEWTWLGDGKA
jgi:uncharacterized damage-inducible protein DinB